MHETLRTNSKAYTCTTYFSYNCCHKRKTKKSTPLTNISLHSSHRTHEKIKREQRVTRRQFLAATEGKAVWISTVNLRASYTEWFTTSRSNGFQHNWVPCGDSVCQHFSCIASGRTYTRYLCPSNVMDRFFLCSFSPTLLSSASG